MYLIHQGTYFRKRKFFMRFAIIADIHIGDYRPFKGVYRKVTPCAETLLKDFVQKMNKSFKPDFVVQGGDIIEEINHTADLENYKKGLVILSKLKCPVYHLVGNHDLKYLRIEDVKRLLGYKNLYFYIDCNNLRLVFLFPKKYPNKEIKLSPSQIKWLKKIINTNKKIIIFSHYSLIPVNTRGNFWFSECPDKTFIKNHRQFIDIISSAKNVKLAFNSHLHWNRKKVLNGVHFVTIQSLVENISKKTEGQPTNAFALITLNNDFAAIEIKGRDGKNYRIKI